jgi:hypothetical protein
MIAELPAAREPSDSISIFPFIPQKKHPVRVFILEAATVN